MESILVGLIVSAAVIFSLRRFVKIYKGEGGCRCGSGCACPSKKSCDSNFPIAHKK